MKIVLIIITFIYQLSIYGQIDNCRVLATATYSSPIEVKLDGTINLLEEINSTKFHEIYKSNVYFLQTYNKAEISQYNLDYEYVSTIEIQTDSIEFYTNFKIISNNKIALLDNKNNRIYFIDFNGNFLHEIDMLNPNEPGHFQNVHGIILNNELIVSENGNRELLAIDTSTYAQRIFKDLSGLNSILGRMQEVDDSIFIATRKAIYSFTEFSEPKLALFIDETNVTGFDITNEHLFFQTNFGGNIYYFNLITKDLELVISGLEDLKLGNLSVIEKECIVSNVLEHKEKIIVFPNPANSEVNIQNRFEGDFEILLFDSIGKLVKKNRNSHRINIDDLKSGFYLLKIRNDKRILEIERIIVTE